jgi:hypothetical protein
MASYKVRIRGTSPLLQHRYPMPDEEKKFGEECEAAGLDPKKTSNIEASWYHNNGGGAYIPAEHIKGALVGAGKGEKVAGRGNTTWNNILKVGVAVIPAEVGFLPTKKTYDYIDKRYCKVGTARVMRERPAFNTGWESEFTLEADAEVDEKNLGKLMRRAGRRGIGDYRPEKGGGFGTFEVVGFERVED